MKYDFAVSVSRVVILYVCISDEMGYFSLLQEYKAHIRNVHSKFMIFLSNIKLYQTFSFLAKMFSSSSGKFIASLDFVFYFPFFNVK